MGEAQRVADLVGQGLAAEVEGRVGVWLMAERDVHPDVARRRPNADDPG
jgi:hypothetical protein